MGRAGGAGCADGVRDGSAAAGPRGALTKAGAGARGRGALSAPADRSAGRAPAARARAHKAGGGARGGAKINCPIKAAARRGGGAAAPGDAGRRIMKCKKLICSATRCSHNQRRTAGRGERGVPPPRRAIQGGGRCGDTEHPRARGSGGPWTYVHPQLPRAPFPRRSAARTMVALLEPRPARAPRRAASGAVSSARSRRRARARPASPSWDPGTGAREGLGSHAGPPTAPGPQAGNGTEKCQGQSIRRTTGKTVSFQLLQ